MANLLGKLEQQIMDVIWKLNKPSSAAEILKELGSTHAYTTVTTVMQRLSKKGVLKRQKKANVYIYSPVSKKKDFVGSMLDNLYKSVFSSYGNMAVSQFVDSIKDDPEALKELRQQINNHKL